MDCVFKVINTSYGVSVDFSKNISLVEQIENIIKSEGYPIRRAIVAGKYDIQVNKGYYDVECTNISNYIPCIQTLPTTNSFRTSKDVFINIVPTGIQASVGGSLGDAMPVNIVLAELGLLITHPNTCNAGPLLIADRAKILYTEGSAIDAWSMNKYELSQTKFQKIGVIIDGTLKDTIQGNRAINAIQGFYAHTGTNFVGYEFTADSIGGEVIISETGACVGTVQNLETIFHACQKLLKKGATHIAIFTSVYVPQEYWKMYFSGSFPNPVGGIEAIITHSITQKFNIISAHGPLIDREEEFLLRDSGIVAPAAGLESANPFYPLCVLRGLMDAPNLVDIGSGLNFSAVSAIFCPHSALGGITVLQAMSVGIPVFAVKENTTIMKAFPSIFSQDSIIEVDSYLEAIGILLEAKRKYVEITLSSLKDICHNIPQNQLAITASEFIEQLGIDPMSLGSKQSQLWNH